MTAGTIGVPNRIVKGARVSHLSFQSRPSVLRLAAVAMAITIVSASVLAYAQTPSLTGTFTSSLSSVSRSGNTSYYGTLKIKTGHDTPVTSKIDVLFDRHLKLNASAFPAVCRAGDIDGKATVPPKCNSSAIGTGLWAHGNVTIYNGLGSRGGGTRHMLLAVRPGKAGAYHVIDGVIRRTAGTFGWTISFNTPAKPPYRQVPRFALLRFGKDKTANVKGGTAAATYVQLTQCPRGHRLRSKAVVYFPRPTGSPPSTPTPPPLTLPISTYRC